MVLERETDENKSVSSQPYGWKMFRLQGKDEKPNRAKILYDLRSWSELGEAKVCRIHGVCEKIHGEEWTTESRPQELQRIPQKESSAKLWLLHGCKKTTQSWGTMRMEHADQPWSSHKAGNSHVLIKVENPVLQQPTDRRVLPPWSSLGRV